MPEHSVHRFTRLISRSDTGMCIYGCAHGNDIAGCGETEVRHQNQPSPYEMRRQAAKRSATSRKHREGA